MTNRLSPTASKFLRYVATSEAKGISPCPSPGDADTAGALCRRGLISLAGGFACLTREGHSTLRRLDEADLGH
jgi:hypothetical protein